MVNKKLLFVAFGLLLLIAAGMAYLLLQKDTPSPEPAATSAEVQAPPRSESPDGTKGRYVDYTEGSFASAQGTKLLFFYAPWCPQCRALDKSIRTSELPAGVTIFKVDYDSNQPLRAKYGVTLQTTVVKTDEKGNEANTFVAYNEPTFQSVKQALLP